METFAGKAKLAFARAGELFLPTGRLVAADPAFLKDAKPFEHRFEPDRYQVILTIAHYADKDQRIAAARVQISSRTPVRWTEARPVAYGVDSGLGCFIDAEAAAHLAALPKTAYERHWKTLMNALDKNYADTRSYTSVRVDSRTNATLVVFSSGFGDGGYASYFGHDDRGQLACLLTDFGLLYTPEEIEAMDDEEEE